MRSLPPCYFMLFASLCLPGACGASRRAPALGSASPVPLPPIPFRRQDSEVMEQITRDVMRTHPDMHFFSGDSDDAEMHRKASCSGCGGGGVGARRLRRAAAQNCGAQVGSPPHARPSACPLHTAAQEMKRALFLYAKLNPGLRYIQGMNELIAPLYHAFKTDPDRWDACSVDCCLRQHGDMARRRPQPQIPLAAAQDQRALRRGGRLLLLRRAPGRVQVRRKGRRVPHTCGVLTPPNSPAAPMPRLARPSAHQPCPFTHSLAATARPAQPPQGPLLPAAGQQHQRHPRDDRASHGVPARDRPAAGGAPGCQQGARAGLGVRVGLWTAGRCVKGTFPRSTPSTWRPTRWAVSETWVDRRGRMPSSTLPAGRTACRGRVLACTPPVPDS